MAGKGDKGAEKGKGSPAMKGKEAAAASPKVAAAASASSSAAPSAAPSKPTASQKAKGHNRNRELARGINKYGRSASYHRSGRWAIKAKQTAIKKVAAAKPKVKSIGGKKNGNERTIVPKGPKFYPADDVPQRRKARKQHQHPTARLRKSITPGTVLILLAGRFRGMRVVFLKQLESGLLLVTGPYKINGIPIRRVNQAYVIATSMKLDVSKVKTEKFNDAYFRRAEKKAQKKSEEGFFSQDNKEKKVVSQSRVADQKEVDNAVMSAMPKDKTMKPYLRSRFTLLHGQYPHLMHF